MLIKKTNGPGERCHLKMVVDDTEADWNGVRVFIGKFIFLEFSV